MVKTSRRTPRRPCWCGSPTFDHYCLADRAHVPDTPQTRLLKLDLACGQSRREGFVGVDRTAMDGVDVVHDLDVRPWPWPDAMIEEVHCSHYIEHTSDLILFMEEMGRILIPGGKATLIAPYYTSMRAWQDPTHRRAICEATFLYFNKGWRHQNKLDHYPITCDFDFSYAYVLSPEWANRAQEARDFAIAHYWNVVSDIQVSLVKR